MGKRSPKITTDDELGMAWWNGITPAARAAALAAANTSVPAEAWKHWRTKGYSPDQLDIGDLLDEVSNSICAQIQEDAKSELP